MDIKEIIKSKPYMITALSLAVIAVLVLIFGGGMYMGYRKARFSYQWGENYHMNFGGPRGGMGGMMRDFGGKDFIDSHGASGQIIKIDSSTIIIKGQDGIEKSILVKDDTTIRRFRETIKLTDLKVGDYIVIIGAPNNGGQIEAKFLRAMPMMASSSVPMMRF